jgi:Uma2 family endonuclease
MKQGKLLYGCPQASRRCWDVVPEGRMSAEQTYTPVVKRSKKRAQALKHNGATTSATARHLTPAPQPTLPVFPLDVGYRTVRDPATGEWRDLPLTLLDLLFPTEDDVGVVKVSQSPWHDRLANLIATILRLYFSDRNWLTTQDVLIHWGRRGIPPKSPDIAAIVGGRMPARRDKSYRVGRDGPLPAFVVEITSEETREEDLTGKKLFYAAVGVQEYLIIDLLAKETTDWKLSGYRLGESPFYEEIPPDADGGLTFQSIGLRFVAIGNQRIELYDATTGERLLTQKMRAEQEKARADQYETLLKKAGLL